MKIKLMKMEELPMDAPLEFVAFYKENGHVCSAEGSVYERIDGTFEVYAGCNCRYVRLEKVIGWLPLSAFDLPGSMEK